MRLHSLCLVLVLSRLLASSLLAAEPARPLVIDAKVHHLRINGPREWDTFPEQPDAAELQLTFQSAANTSAWTLQLFQEDLKQTWTLRLNGRQLGRLVRDENPMLVCFDVPAGAVRSGENTLTIVQNTGRRSTPDDIHVGQITLFPRPQSELLSAARVKVTVRDAETQLPLPARITILNEQGTLQSVGAESNTHLAVREGTVYTGSGHATFGLPAGKYTIFAGRGFEYSLASREITIAPGDEQSLELTIAREVPTAGYVACDTHVHTLTHSRHGDATVQERMLTLAGEGIELPVAADHNVHVDHRPFAREMNVARWFTPVTGNEVTTPTAHFNVFPVQPGAAVPDWKQRDWKTTLGGIFATPGVRVAILNHARDLHSGVRPFGPALFNEATGEKLDGQPIAFNAMEVVNSSANQTDTLQLFRDWMALLNRGHQITPVGSSDSHDVARHFVGQGRTYIRCDDSDPGAIDIEQATTAFLKGEVLVSYGLLAEIQVNGKYGPGRLVPLAEADDEVEVALRVLGPHWVDATRLMLFTNGRLTKSINIDIDSQTAGKLPPGVKWQGTWSIPRPRHDAHLVAIASGPGVEGLHWRTAKPYQPTSPHWEPAILGATGAVWLDGNGDGKRQAASDIARRVFEKHAEQLPELLQQLAAYDSAVAVQAAGLYQGKNESLLTAESQRLIAGAAPQVRDGFRQFLTAWRASRIAQSEQQGQ